MANPIKGPATYQGRRSGSNIMTTSPLTARQFPNGQLLEAMISQPLLVWLEKLATSKRDTSTVPHRAASDHRGGLDHGNGVGQFWSSAGTLP